MNAGEIASKKASSKNLSASSTKQQSTNNIAGLTTYDDLMSEYQTDIVKTPSGLTFIIQTINPGDYLAIIGTPLLKYMSAHGIDISDPQARTQAVMDMPANEQVEILSDPNFQEMLKSIVCAGIVPHDKLRVVNKRAYDCDKSKYEVSIDVIPVADLYHIFIEIMKLSQGEEFADEIELFREQHEIRPGEAVADPGPSDGESLQQETEPDIVSSNSES